MKHMHCPTCEPKSIVMALESEKYGNGNLSQTWKCHFCGTIATTCIPCVVVISGDCAPPNADVDSAPQ